MSTFAFKSLSFAFVSIISATAVADTMLLVSRNAIAGPKQEAVIACVQAARGNTEFGDGIVLSSRSEMKSGPSTGVRSFVMKGTTWENGARIPIVVRCVTGKRDGTVASISRVQGDSRVASTAR